MDLSCEELENVSNACTAKRDRGIFNDERVINNLLNDEIFYIPNCDYFKTVQNDVQPFMRKVVTTWMLEVCEEQLCEDQVLPLAVNLMDRFLCVCVIKRQQLQLLGATCLLIASKIRSTNLLPVDLLCAYTDYSVTYAHIVSWEQLVLSKLQWNISGVTGFDYIDQVIERCPWARESGLLRRHAHTLVSICYTEPSLIQTPPSVIAASCLSSAVRGLKLCSANLAIEDICRMLNVKIRTIELLVSIIDNAVANVASLPTANQETKVSAKYETTQYPQPETPPPEVDNIFF